MAWFNSKKYKQNKSLGISQSVATASVAGDLGNMDDFDIPNLKHIVLPTNETLNQLSVGSLTSAFKKFSPTLLNGQLFASTPI
jgi:hypothetical protein